MRKGEIINARSWIVSCFIFLATLETTSADGKFYHPNLIPRIPEQRALILYDVKEEILLMQSTYESKAGSFGWIVPLPSVPKFASMNAGEAEMLFNRLYNISSPDITNLSGVKFLIGFGVWITLLTLVNLRLSGRLRILLNAL